MKTTTLMFIAGAGALAYYVWSKRSTPPADYGAPVSAGTVVQLVNGVCQAVTTTTYADGTTKKSYGPASSSLCPVAAPASGMGSYVTGLRRS
jgi:hypothetical protein